MAFHFSNRACCWVLRGTWSAVLMGCVMIVVQGLAHSSPPLTPRQVVEQWLQVYPRHLDRAADLTTENFREGASKEAWIASRGMFLQNLRLKYVRAKIAHEKMIGEEVHVIVHAHISTLMGDQPQDELYILQRDHQDHWVVEAIEVYTDSFNRVP